MNALEEPTEIGEGEWDCITAAEPNARKRRSIHPLNQRGGKLEALVGDKEVFGDGTVAVINNPAPYAWSTQAASNAHAPMSLRGPARRPRHVQGGHMGIDIQCDACNHWHTSVLGKVPFFILNPRANGSVSLMQRGCNLWMEKAQHCGEKPAC